MQENIINILPARVKEQTSLRRKTAETVSTSEALNSIHESNMLIKTKDGGSGRKN